MTQLLEKVPDWLRTFPAFRKMEAEKQKQLDAERSGAMQRIKAARAELKQVIPPLWVAERAAADKIKEAETALQTAKDERQHAWVRRHNTEHRLQATIDEQVGFLEETADSRIAELIAELFELQDPVRRGIATSPAGRDPYTGALSLGKSNRKEVLKALETIKDAMSEAGALQCAVVDDVGKRLATLRATVDAAVQGRWN